MRDKTFKAYLVAVAASAIAMDLLLIAWSRAYMDIESLSDVIWLPLMWAITFGLTLVGSFVPAAAMVGFSQRFEVRSLAYFLTTSCAGSELLACMVTGLLWAPDVPPGDPEYLPFQVLLLRMSVLLIVGGGIGGLTYWTLAGRHSPDRTPS